LMVEAATIKPPVIDGAVPGDYRGPLCYRLRSSGDSAKKPLVEMIGFADRNAKRKFIQIDQNLAARRMDPWLCDENGDLLPEWRTPIKAKLLANANKSWDEFSSGGINLVSERIRDVVERLAPGVHYFIPVDIDDRHGATFRVYMFFCGMTRLPTVLAMEANGIEYTLFPDGTPRYAPPAWIYSNAFGYLDLSAIDGAPLLYSRELGFLFSQELVDRLGQIMPEGTVFVPMGLA
jgi:uncharacterized protein DUF1629